VTSIRRRTSLLVAASMSTVLALGGVALFVVVRAALTGQFDESLVSRAAALQSLTRMDRGAVEMDIAGEVLPRYQAGADAEYFVAWVRDERGWRVLERSESLRGGAWITGADTPPPPGAADAALPDGRAGRLYTVEFRPVAEEEAEGERVGENGSTPAAGDRDAAPPVRVLVAQSRGPLDRVLATIALAIGGVGLAMVLASLAATRWAVRRGTASLARLSANVAALGPDTLDQRVDARELPDELTPVAARLNDLLARLHEAFERERRFSAAASHELRTPIAELRMLLEVALSRSRSAEEWSVTGAKAIGVLDRAQSLCESLLRLSRAEAGVKAISTHEPAFLAPILAEQANRAISLHGGVAGRLTVQCPPELAAHIDSAALTAIIGNLLDNALRHGDVTPEHPAECIAHGDHEGVTVTVCNHAPKLSPADVPRLFEPFWQADVSRAGREGFGLGLAIARALAIASGARLGASIDTNHTLVVWLRIQSASKCSALPS